MKSDTLFSSTDAIQLPVESTRRNRSGIIMFILIGVMVVGLIVAGGVIYKLHQNNTTALHNLSHTRAVLAHTKKNLGNTKNELSDAQAQVSTCQGLEDVSTHTLNALQHTTQAYLDNTNGDPFSSLLSISKGKSETSRALRAIHSAGYSSLPELIAACDGNGTGI